MVKRVEQNNVTTVSKKSPEIKKIIIDEKLDTLKIKGSPVNIENMAINGDELSLFVSYSGGCKQHVFELYANKKFDKSKSPKLTLYLKHIGNDDACRKLILRELKFDIAEIKYSDSLLIRINDQTIKYGPK